jgi:hypothetical protein
MKRPNFYKILGVPSHAPQKEIESAYRQLVRTCHPDICRTQDAEERMKDINGAYEILSDPEKRQQYDGELEGIGSVAVSEERSGHAAEPSWYDPRYKHQPRPAEPRQYSYRAPLAAGAAGILVVLILLIFLTSGIHGPAPAEPPVIPSVTPTPLITPYPVSLQSTMEETPVQNATDFLQSSLVPGPTRTPPANLMAFIQIDKDSITNDVTVSLAGGSGQPVIKEIVFRLTCSDGRVLENTIVLDPSRKSNEATLPGTRQGDQAEVTVIYYSGQEYKVIDRLIY